MPTRFSKSGLLVLDTNVLDAVTSSVLLPVGASHKSIFVVGKTGSHSTHQVQLQGSPNEGANWFDMNGPITSIGMIEDHVCQCLMVRCRTSVVEGSSSTCEIYIIAS